MYFRFLFRSLIFDLVNKLITEGSEEIGEESSIDEADYDLLRDADLDKVPNTYSSKRTRYL